MTLTGGRLVTTAVFAFSISDGYARAEEQDEWRLLCAPALLLEPTWTIHNLAHRSLAGLPRERIAAPR
jgi:hypothetical protein